MRTFELRLNQVEVNQKNMLRELEQLKSVVMTALFDEAYRKIEQQYCSEQDKLDPFSSLLLDEKITNLGKLVKKVHIKSQADLEREYESALFPDVSDDLLNKKA